ncbi:Methyltransferase type 11 [Paenibacillus curdlanolyticus YK9]|uniref:Methyltransferase type 11 n=1 Tax=Paenibacillus curdlanolyticus YK9 TaxID=717606 RepID=E0IFY2_9BACL|nr:class I SAM-dependent methyltransferase [Paenibacillus curdlanolyticus]EFM08562.1 Methyltransferase type 11 [Paenibacillus curdlanolyticus YK9]
MKQNKYDDQGFFDKYKEMPRSISGLESAGEWPALKQLIPDLRDKRVLDLGCGYGWHCRYAREQGARSVVGVDISAKMLERAKSYGDDPAITYVQLPIEDIAFDAEQFDVVISSLALHYIADFEAVCRQIAHALAPGGTFVLSVEHPIFTARAAQDWHYGAEGERLHWPVDDYQSEGLRQTRFLDNDVVKYHRTLATLLNALISAGFTIAQLSEPQPTQEAIEQYPDMRDETRRPIFLLVAAFKAASTE